MIARNFLCMVLMSRRRFMLSEGVVIVKQLNRRKAVLIERWVGCLVLNMCLIYSVLNLMRESRGWTLYLDGKSVPARFATWPGRPLTHTHTHTHTPPDRNIFQVKKNQRKHFSWTCLYRAVGFLVGGVAFERGSSQPKNLPCIYADEKQGSLVTWRGLSGG